MLFKMGMKVVEDCTNFNYRTPRPQKVMKSKNRATVVWTGNQPALAFMTPGGVRGGLEKNPPQMR